MEARGITSTHDTLRLFWALDLPPEAKRGATACARELAARRGGDALRWLPEESFHVTLHFLGSVPRTQVPEMVAAVTEQLQDEAPFEARLGNPQAFPPSRPRMVALAVEPAVELSRLAAAVVRGVVAAGFPAEERAFHPHLTLGRVRRGQRVARHPGEKGFAVTGSVTAPGQTWKVVESTLFQSQLEPSGAHYQPLARVPLAGTAAETAAGKPAGTASGTLHP